MNSLPIGWDVAKINELIGPDGLFSDGDWVESKDQDPNGMIRLLQLADIGDGVFLNKSNRHINEEQFNRLRCTEVFGGDVLIARMPEPLGRSCIMPFLSQRCVTVVDVAIVRLGSLSANSKWLMFFLNTPSIRQEIELKSTGTTRRRIARSKLAEMQLPIPPLNEQKRIADKLDSILARVDACRERLDCIPVILKRFRQAVLAAATSGKLTEEWRKTTEYIEEWTINPLKALCSRVSVGHVGQTSQFYTTSDIGIPFLRSQNVRPGYVSIEGLAYITQDFHNQLQKSQLQAGDLLIVRVGANRGDSCVLPNMFDKVNCANIVFARPTKILPAYLSIFFQSPSCQEDLLNKTVGGAQGVINTKSVELINVKVPPYAEQTEIVRRVEELFSYADRIEARYHAARARVDKLTPAILAKAFRGGLVPQDPNDEPASVLLERIRASRAENAVTPKSRRSLGKKTNATDKN